MKKILVFATHNKHKLQEAQQIIGPDYELRGLSDIGCNVDIPETGTTLKENAYQKAMYVKQHFGFDCFADDTGLEVDALNGAPGVYSARYAGEGCDFDDNINKLLGELNGVENRKARFRTVVALVEGETITYFDGEVNGMILTERHGEHGFGYDSIFQPDGYQESFAELTAEQKNSISHRGRAMQKFVAYLKK